MKSIFVIIALLFCAQVPAANIYKCVSSDGKTTFSQHPCGEEAEQMNVRNPRSDTGEVPERKSASQQLQDLRALRNDSGRSTQRSASRKSSGCDHLSSTSRRNMVVQDKLFRCMTKSELKKVLGSPQNIHSGSRGAAAESWHYHYDDGTSTHVFFDENGLVKNWTGWR